MATFCIIQECMKAVAETSTKGCYTVEATSLAESRRSSRGPFAAHRTFQHFKGILSAGAAHLKGVIQSELFTLTTYDAKGS